MSVLVETCSYERKRTCSFGFIKLVLRKGQTKTRHLFSFLTSWLAQLFRTWYKTLYSDVPTRRIRLIKMLKVEKFLFIALYSNGKFSKTFCHCQVQCCLKNCYHSVWATYLFQAWKITIEVPYFITFLAIFFFLLCQSTSLQGLGKKENGCFLKNWGLLSILCYLSLHF